MVRSSVYVLMLKDPIQFGHSLSDRFAGRPEWLRFGVDSGPNASRSSYVLDLGGRADLAADVLAARPIISLSRLTIGEGSNGGVWSKAYRITDRLVAPFLAEFGKA